MFVGVAVLFIMHMVVTLMTEKRSSGRRIVQKYLGRLTCVRVNERSKTYEFNRSRVEVRGEYKRRLSQSGVVNECCV